MRWNERAEALAQRPDRGVHVSAEYSAREKRRRTPRSLGNVDVLDDLPRVHASTRVQLAIRDAVAAERPVHQDRLARLIAAAFGLGRVNDARAKSILRCAPTELRPQDGEGFFWPADIVPSAGQIVRRASAGEQRSIDQVSLIEIANAMRIAADTSGGMDGMTLWPTAWATTGGASRRL
ncbi:DUF3320 domain-containing protein [Rathayibacter sp. CAU 1779]